MKKFKVLSFLLIFISLFTFGLSASADSDEDFYRPDSTITIKGIEGNYVVCYAAKKLPGSNYDYNSWIKNYRDELEYNSIMKYSDEDGYKWITTYFKCNGDTEIKFPEQCPNTFKIVIYKNNRLYAVTEPLEQYAYATYYEVDFTLVPLKGQDFIVIKNTYDYTSDIINLVLRIVGTILIEIGILYLFRLQSRRNLSVVLIINIVTQTVANAIISYTTYAFGLYDAIVLFSIMGFILFVFESIVYLILLKTRKKVRKFFYPLIASTLSFILSLIIFIVI